MYKRQPFDASSMPPGCVWEAPGGILEASKRHPGDTQKASGRCLEAPRRHLEVSRRHPEASRSEVIWSLEGLILLSGAPQTTKPDCCKLETFNLTSCKTTGYMGYKAARLQDSKATWTVSLSASKQRPSQPGGPIRGLADKLIGHVWTISSNYRNL